MKHTRSLVVGAILVSVIPLLGRASGQNSVGSANAYSGARHRPAGVPDEYAITPFGYFHPSCIQRLAKGERLIPDGRIQHADGNVEESVATCNYPHYAASGGPAIHDALTLPEVDGWIESASTTTGSPNKSYGALIATWTVPPQPTADHGQWLFFFPGFEDINNPQTSILQPVLQWAQRQWAIASWNCCLNNVTTESPLVNVRPGDEIYGSITSDCPAATVSCPTWNVLSLDLSTGESTALTHTPSQGQVFNWAFGGVLEPYYVTSCEDYPPNHTIAFDKATVFDEYLRPIVGPQWTESTNTTQDPQCGYAVQATRRKIRLDY